MKYTTSGRKKGFTLIELLVVVAIVATLGSIGFVAFKGSQVKSRDARRLSDLNAVRTALNAYYNQHRYYPTFITALQPITDESGNTTYLDQTPVNPSPRTDHGCPDSDYVYTVAPDNKSYSLTTCVGDAGSLETVSAIDKGLFYCGDPVTDRDDNVYSSVQIGFQCWLGENLKTKTWPDGEVLTMGDASAERDCITESNERGTESDCEAGRTLYKSDISSTICPTGWHIPTDAEFVTMEQYLTDPGQTCTSNRGWTGGGACLTGTPDPDGCLTGGLKLKTGGSTGFNWQFTGFRSKNDSFSEVGDIGYLISQTSATCGTGSNAAGTAVRAVADNSNGIKRNRLTFSPFEEETERPAAGVRCIKD